MAPRGSKRASTAGAGAAKRRAVANPAFEKCDAIAKALSTANRDVVPKAASDMLVPMLRSCLAVPKELRHEHQAAVVGMVGTVLQNVAGALEADIELREQACGGVAADRAARRTALEEAKAGVTGFEADVAAKKEALNSAATHCSTKATELVTAEKAFGEVDKEYRKVTGHRDELKGAVAALELLKGTCAGTPEGKAQHKQLAKACTAFEIESDLSEVVLKCLKRDAALRQSFDVLALQKIDDEFQKRIAELDQNVQALDEPQSQAKESSRIAREARTAADEARTSCHGELAQARGAEKAGHQQVKAAEKRLDAWWHDARVTMDGYDNQVKALAALREGPLAAFAALLELQPEPDAAAAKEEAGAAEEVEPAAAGADTEEAAHEEPRSEAVGSA